MIADPQVPRQPRGRLTGHIVLSASTESAARSAVGMPAAMCPRYGDERQEHCSASRHSLTQPPAGGNGRGSTDEKAIDELSAAVQSVNEDRKLEQPRSWSDR